MSIKHHSKKGKAPTISFAKSYEEQVKQHHLSAQRQTAIKAKFKNKG